MKLLTSIFIIFTLAILVEAPAMAQAKKKFAKSEKPEERAATLGPVVDKQQGGEEQTEVKINNQPDSKASQDALKPAGVATPAPDALAPGAPTSDKKEPEKITEPK